MTVLSIGVLIGVVGGLSVSLHDVIANRYLPYQMFRLVAFSLQLSLNKWVMLSVLLVLLWVAMKLIWDFFASKRGMHEEISRRGFCTLTICLLIFLCGGWAVNHYWLPHRFHPISLLGDIGMLFLTACLGRVFLRVPLEKIGIPLENILKTEKTKYIRRAALVFGALLVLLNVSLAIDQQINAPKGPNVIILLVDALRKDHLGLYGYHRETTPNIDRFSQEAVIFQNAISQSSWTPPSIASLFSSFYPSVHGVISRGRSKEHSLDDKIVTFAEVLKEKGYKTAAFLANPIIIKRASFDQGFDVFVDRSHVPPPKVIRKAFRWITKNKYELAYLPAPELNRRALQWIHQNKNSPFFAYLHYMDVHSPYELPQPYDSFFQSNKVRLMNEKEVDQFVHFEEDHRDLNYYIDRYDGGIRFMDAQIGQLLKKLEEYGLLKNTIVVITADHGEAFLDHGFSNHGWTLYQEEINVPLIVKLPETMASPRKIQDKVGLIDIGVTILSALNYSFPYKTDGLDLFAGSTGDRPDDRPLFAAELSEISKGPPKIAMIKGGTKAIYLVAEQRVTELYNLARDPLEKRNLIHRSTEKRLEFERAIQAWLAEGLQTKEELGVESPFVTISDQRRERLKALGYLQ